VQLLSNSKVLHISGMNGRKLIEQKYSFAAQVENYIALYKTLLLRPKHRRSGEMPQMPLGPASLARF
jgi:hypothetical protein